MTIFLLFILFVSTYLLWFWLEDKHKKKSLPPGPPVFPVVGSVLSVARAHPQPHLAFVKLAEEYGDVMRLRMGVHEYVVLSSPEALTDIYTMDESLGRPNHGINLDIMEVPNTGIGYSTSEPWKNKRAWMARALRELGIGRTSYFEETTRSMIGNFHGNLRADLKADGKVIKVDDKMELGAGWMMWGLLVGSNTPEDITDYEKFLHAGELWLDNAAFGSGILIIAPFLKYIFPGFTNHTNTKNFVHLAHRLGEKLYSKLILMKEEFPQNFFHSYILEQRRGTEGFSNLDFRCTFQDVTVAALDTNDAYLRSVVLFLTLYPSEQDKLYEEIKNGFPTSHVFTMADLKLMPNTQAFMLEVHRLGILATNWAPRAFTADVVYRGFTFKKGTAILPNLHSAFKSKLHFGPDPDSFRPQRFIDPSDPSKLSELRKLVTPFSIGKRACPGESIATIVTFLTLVSTVRNFRLSPVPGEIPPTEEFCVGITAKPRPFKVLVCPRFLM